jgi:preprotein translocase subunit SecB
MNASQATPSIDLALQIDACQGGNLYEIELNYRVTATHEHKITFQIELCFAGLFEITGASREQTSRFVYVEAPRILYPHAAKIATDLARDGGLPDLEIAEPDFLTIWKARGTGLLDPKLTLPETTYATVFNSSA